MGCAWLGALGRLGEHRASFLGAWLLAGLGYVLALRSLRSEGMATSCRRTTVGILTVAVALRILALALPASDDVARYLWEGRLQQLGGSPYELAPADAAETFARARIDPQRVLVNHPELTTIYPPLAQLLFRGVAAVSYDPMVWKLLMGLVDLGVIVALLVWQRSRELPASSLLAYAWHPLPVVAFAGEGHLDAVLLLGTTLAFLAAARGRAGALGAAWAGAVGTKLAPLVLAPVFVPFLGVRGWLTLAAVFAGCVAAFPEAGAGLWRVGVEFGTQMRHNGSVAALLGLVLPPRTAAVSAAALFLLGTGWSMRRPWREPWEQGLFLTALLLLVSPTVHPWYFTWLVPYFVSYRAPAFVGLTLTGGIAYVAYGYAAQDSIFRLPAGWVVLEYLPLVLMGISLSGRRWFRDRISSAPHPPVR